jgi:co-chaperonin GroES (HSP10)
MQLLKDQIAAEFLADHGTIFSKRIIIPDNHRVGIYAVPARVVHIGSKFRYADEVKVGDIVYVPSHFGNPFNGSNKVRTFNGEDVWAIRLEN